MNRKKNIDSLLLAVLIFVLFLIPSAIYKLHFVKFILSSVPYLAISGVISLILGFTVRENKKLGGLLVSVCLFMVSAMVMFISFMEKQDAEKVEWNASKDRFTIDFVVGNEGHIYLNASFNDTCGLFIFDTGCPITYANEQFLTDKKMKFRPYSMKDVNGILQTKILYKANRFELGDIEIKQLHVYPSDSLMWTDPQGAFYQQDSVIGIIGNNIISKFIWDFDLISKRVTISKSKNYCNEIPDSLSVPLFSNNGNKDISVKINGAEKRLTFDFGASNPLYLSDTIPYKSATDKKGYSESSKGMLNHLDSMKGKERSFDFVDVELNGHTFQEVKCSEKGHCNLLGIPFMWTFERVIVDYLNDKAYFINKNDRSGSYSLGNFNREGIWKKAKVMKFITKPKGMLISIKKDSIETRLVFYGRLTLFQNNSLDSVFYQDSVLLTNGQIKYGPSTVKF